MVFFVCIDDGDYIWICNEGVLINPDYFNPNGFSFMPRSLFQTIDSKYKNIFDYIEVI